MKLTARMIAAARLGRWLGGVWGGCLRAERRAHRWLILRETVSRLRWSGSGRVGFLPAHLTAAVD